MIMTHSQCRVWALKLSLFLLCFAPVTLRASAVLTSASEGVEHQYIRNWTDYYDDEPIQVYENGHRNTMSLWVAPGQYFQHPSGQGAFAADGYAFSHTDFFHYEDRDGWECADVERLEAVVDFNNGLSGPRIFTQYQFLITCQEGREPIDPVYTTNITYGATASVPGEGGFYSNLSGPGRLMEHYTSEFLFEANISNPNSVEPWQFVEKIQTASFTAGIAPIQTATNYVVTVVAINRFTGQYINPSLITVRGVQLNSENSVIFEVPSGQWFDITPSIPTPNPTEFSYQVMVTASVVVDENSDTGGGDECGDPCGDCCGGGCGGGCGE